MSVNWSGVGSTLSGLTSALSAAGVSSTSMGSILSAIGLNSNPNESAEIALCQQILTYSAMGAVNPALVSMLADKLATEQGIPADAGALALTLVTPGVNIPQTILQIEQLIKQGG
jgi:hypothetical protein